MLAEISEATKITMSSAGSARKPTIISRRAPSVPNAVPTSIAASDMKTRAVANSPTSAIASAASENGRRVPIEGMIAAAHTMVPNTTYGATRNSGEALRGEHRVLVKELANAAIRLQQARRRLVLQPGAALVDPADEQRRGQQRGEHFENLREPVQRTHSTSASSTSRVTKLYSR